MTHSNISAITLLQVMVLNVASIVGACVASIFYQSVYRPTFPKND